MGRRFAFGALIGLFSCTAASAETFTGSARVVDGDTLEIGATKFRLHGIDTPELAQPYGKDATRQLTRLTDGMEVRCDGNEWDDYKRLIAICFAGQTNLNEAMMRSGMAWAFVKYSSDYVGLEKEARTAHVGLWKNAAAVGLGIVGQAAPQPPWEFRAQRWAAAEQTAPAGCPIKGNISKSGDRIYHVPWTPGYERTRVSEGRGEKWFCSEAEAVAAGWRAVR